MTETVEIRAPAEQTEGTRSQLLRWLKAVGAAVAQNEPLIEIETDKVTVEIASPESGTLIEIVKGEQDEIVPGELLGRIESSRINSAECVDVSDGPGAAFSGAAPASTHPTQDGVVANAARRAASASSPDSAAAATSLSPAVRRLLAENAFEPASLSGTGQDGRITVQDVMRAIATKTFGNAGGAAAEVAHTTVSRAAARTDSVPAASAGASRPEVSGGSHRIPHTPIRKRIAEHMVQSLLHSAPHVTTIFEADLSAVLAHRLKSRAEFAARGAPLTLTAYFLHAAVAALRAVPEANSRWTDTALEVFDSIHIGIATALEAGGLVVPVLHDVQSLDLFAIARGLNDLVVRAREGRLVPADVRGGTFTISNHGVSGSLVATPIVINQPQAAILGIGKLEKRPVVMTEGGEDRIAIRPQCYVTLTIDHRVMDGHQANRFLQTFVERLTNWPA